MDDTRDGRVAAMLSMFAAVTCFSIATLGIKHLAAHVDVWTVNGTRYTVAALFWLPAVLLKHRSDPASRGVWRAALVPALVNSVAQTCWGMTPYHNDAAVIGFAIRSSFLFTIVFGMLWVPSERVLLRIPSFWMATLTAAIGLLVMYSGSLRASNGTTAFGLGLIVFTAMLWGLYAVTVRRFLSGYSVRQSFGVVSIYTSVALVTAMLLRGDVSSLATVGRGNIGLIVVSAFIGIAIGHVLMFRAIHALGPVFCYGVGLVGPFITWLGAALILHETMSGMEIVGGLIIVLGTCGLVRAKYVADRGEGRQNH